MDSCNLHSITATAPPHLDSIVSADDDFGKLLAEFPEITTPSFDNPTPKHGVNLFIPTKGPRTSPCTGTTTSPRQIEDRQGRIQENGDHLSFQQPVGLTPPRGSQGIRRLEAMWRLPTLEQCHHARSLSCTTYTRFCSQLGRRQNFLQAGSCPQLPSNPCSPNDISKTAVITLLGCLNSSACHLVGRTQHRHPSDSWTQCFGDDILVASCT